MKKLTLISILMAGGFASNAMAASHKECNVNADITVEGCAWEREGNWVTTNAVKTDLPEPPHQLDVYVCTDLSNVPGKLVDNKCWVPWHGKEYRQDQFYVLSADPAHTYWEKVTSRVHDDAVDPKNKLFFTGRMDGHHPNYICAVNDGRPDQKGKSMIAGKLVGGLCWYSWGGHEYAVDPANPNDKREVFVLRWRGDQQ
ncbi:hypothetical protein [Algicola sagamiensis]|uniref:hypothetical protein n=1 Tax=Algicola sagamiensis TaxID=163869 RepID=UPI001B7F8A47|nr:hypothetical protein [Algicola sagamiensis]